MKKETREKILGLGLFGIIASVPVAGIAVAGCSVDERKDIVKTTCMIGGVEARAVYHQINGDPDYMTLDLYKGNAIISRIYTKNAWLQCDDGRVLNFENDYIVVEDRNIVEAEKAEQ